MNVGAFIDKNFERTIRFNKEDNGSLVGMPYPYTTPCADNTFLEMYYWDTYFTNVGLLKNDMAEQAKNNVNNVIYMVEKFGFMPNGNRTYYLNRSQPPFLYAMVRDVFDFYGDTEWLKSAFATLEKEYRFWQTERLADNGLNFYGNYTNITPETVDALNKDFKKRSGGYETNDEKIRLCIAKTIKTFVESGWDCNSRFGLDGEHYNPVDLNSLLYGFEMEMSKFSDILKNGKTELWLKRAEKRKAKMKSLMWDNERQIYADWNFEQNCFSKVSSAASLYPMFTGLCDDQTGTVKLLKELLLEYGVSGSTRDNLIYSLQWDYPNIWPPIQYIAYISCKKYGYEDLADEIAQKYLKLIDNGFEKTGNLWEKYDGNDGTVATQDYAAPAMMGWTAGVYLYFKKAVTK